MNKEIVLITDYLGFIRQNLKVVSSLDIEKIKSILKENGFSVKVLNFDEIVNRNLNLKNKYIIYSSSQQLEYKAYLDDILFTLSKNNELIPKYEIFRAHENKGYQEILKKERSIPTLNSYYLSNERDLLNFKDSIDYPIVFKNVAGSRSTGVYKINSFKELLNVLKKEMNTKYKLKESTKRIIKKSLKHDVESKYLGRFVLQEYIPNLQDDWKVLMFNGKYYVLNRKVRKGDFRASGSGLISHLDPPEGMLDFAKEVIGKLDVPFISLDICHDGSKFHLLEYQGLHMGPITLINSEHYFINVNGNWEKVYETSDFSSEYAYSIVNYIRNL